ncbi:MAG: hypothetical protein ABL884_02625 [Methyloglobulus sp.]
MNSPFEIRKLNSLRGFAALIVLISHYSNLGLWGKTLGNGAGQIVLVPNLQIGNRQGKLQLAKQHSQAELGNERNN